MSMNDCLEYEHMREQKIGWKEKRKVDSDYFKITSGTESVLARPTTSIPPSSSTAKRFLFKVLYDIRPGG